MIAGRILENLPGMVVEGTAVNDAQGTTIAAEIIWPDGGHGRFEVRKLSSVFPGYIDSYRMTHQPAEWRLTYEPAKSDYRQTYLQPSVRRDPAGAIVDLPPIMVT